MHIENTTKQEPKIEALQPWHLERIRLQSAQKSARQHILDPHYYPLITAQGQAYALLQNGEVLACYGIQNIWEGRATIWSLLSEHSARQMVLFFRVAQGFVNQLQIRRLEAYIDKDFEQARRWITMLGFEEEGLMRGFYPNGDDAHLYARVKPVNTSMQAPETASKT